MEWDFTSKDGFNWMAMCIHFGPFCSSKKGGKFNISVLQEKLPVHRKKSGCHWQNRVHHPVTTVKITVVILPKACYIK